MYCGNANERQDAGSDHSSAAEGSAVNLEVAGSGSVAWLSFFHFILLCTCVCTLVYACMLCWIHSEQVYVQAEQVYVYTCVCMCVYEREREYILLFV